MTIKSVDAVRDNIISCPRYPRYDGLTVDEASRRWEQDKMNNDLVVAERRFWSAVFLARRSSLRNV